MPDSSDNIHQQTEPAQLQDKQQSPYLLISVIMVILVAGIGYYLSVADNEPSDRAAQVDNTGQESNADSHVLKPIPIPAMANGETENNAVASNPQRSSAPAVSSKRETPQNAPTPASAQTPAAQVSSRPEKPKATVRQNTPTDRDSIPPQAASTRSAWAVNLMALLNHDSALKELQHLRAKGFNPELARVKTGGRMFYRVRIANLSSRKAAEKTRALFRAMPEYSHAWINHYKK